MLIRTAEGEEVVIDYRETAPSKSNAAYFEEHPDQLLTGGLSVAIPGQIAGLAVAHSKYGKMKWEQLFNSAAELAERGFTVTKKLTAMINSFAADLKLEPVLAKDYFKPGVLGTLMPKEEGDIVQRPELAKTLYAIGKEGKGVFYEGHIGQSLVKHLKEKHGGIISMDDLKSYTPIERKPLRFKLGSSFTVITAGAPACGAILIHALGILERVLPEHKEEDIYAMIEALKYAYGGRISLGDGVTDVEKILLDPVVMEKHAKEIKWEKTRPVEEYLHDFPKVVDEDQSKGTTHVSVIDASGMAVSCTDTVNLEWGSRIADPVTGILLNNEMGDFSVRNKGNSYDLPPSAANLAHPGKRPLSTSVPVIVIDGNGRIFSVIGAAGGSRMASVMTQLLMRLLLQKYPPGTLYSLIMEGRLHHQLIPNEVVAEHRVDRAVQDDLLKRGHKLTMLRKCLYLTSVQAIVWDEEAKGWRAISDPRKGGYSAGD